MINFYNDHLVSPKFCKLLYDFMPSSIHVPVVFVPHSPEHSPLGIVTARSGVHIELNLQSIYYYKDSVPGSTDFQVWFLLLSVAFHEFGHLADFVGIDPILINGPKYREKDYHQKELSAHFWKDRKLKELALRDKRLFQPQKLGPYFDGRIANSRKNDMRWSKENGTLFPYLRKDYRCFKSGGQLSISEVAEACNECGFNKHGRLKSNTRLIRKLAGDLAYFYEDNAGRLLMFFAWGDLEEISRRVKYYRLKYPKKKRTFHYCYQCLENIDEHGCPNCEISSCE